ncbi:MAG: M20 family metallopeptidase [Victivallales bacterium]|nr:M20 family metallopeptidase [Victivallales bacterium]
MNVEILSGKIHQLVLSRGEEFRKLAHSIWKNPELGLAEKFACARQVELLARLGFSVESPYCGQTTAYKAERGRGTGPTFCYVAEYDALPEIGHACGHNLICTAAIAAGWATAEMLAARGLPGKVVVMGTPGEESKGGKVLLLDHNALDGIDAVMMVHPLHCTMPDSGSTAICRFDVKFKGKSAHAAVSPELGRNALDAVMLTFAGINAWRQHLPETARIHGVVTEGGTVPNVVPELAGCRFFLRTPDNLYLQKLEKRFRAIVKGAAMMTGTRSRIDMVNRPYQARRPNPSMNRAYVAAAAALGLNPETPQHPDRGSSDFGNFSQLRPGIHPYFSITPHKIAAHSTEFTAAADTDYAMEQTFKAAAGMAAVGFNYLTDDAFRQEVDAGV